MHTSIKSGKLKASMVLIGLAITGSISAQSFPNKPVEMTILFGSTAQTIGQVLADQMSKNLPQPVVPVSRPGGGGATGYIHVQAQAADGYNIVWNSNSINTSYHSGKIKFDYKAFTPIARISEEPVAVAVRTDSGWSSLKDVAEAVNSGKTKLRVGASGKGSFTHMTTHSIFASLGIQDRIISVPYDGGKAPLELLADRVDLAVQWPGQFMSHAKAGNLKILCVSGGKRSSHLPDVPTCNESGAKGVDLTMWRGLAAPAGTPSDVIAKLEAAAKAATESAEFKSAAEKIGFEIEFLPAKAFGEVIASDDKKFESLMKEIGLKK